MTDTAFRKLELAFAALAAAVFVILPLFTGEGSLLSITVFLILALLSVSMSLVWGMAGIFSFGQTVFFGIAAYAYSVIMINTDNTLLSVGAAVAIACAVALAIGYFTIYGRVSDLYIAVITLAVSLLIYQYINTLSGEAARIGAANLGGYTGMPGVPPLSMPGDPTLYADVRGMYFISLGALVAAFAGVRILERSVFGQSVVAVRENELRAELLGYDSRLYRLAVFVVGGAIAGLAGVLYAAWGGFIEPSVFSLAFAAQPIIWTVAGGVASPIGPVLGSLLVQGFTTWLGARQIADNNIVLGLIFIAFVLLVPQGLVPAIRRLVVRETSS